MIKSNELRIGNWLQDGETGNPCQLTEDNIESFFYNLKGGDYKPILITPYVLEKCGLKERYCKGEWSWAECSPYHFWTGYTEIRQRDHGYQYLTEQYPLIKYLHQLQNLYFAITGQELIYTP